MAANAEMAMPARLLYPRTLKTFSTMRVIAECSFCGARIRFPRSMDGEVIHCPGCCTPARLFARESPPCLAPMMTMDHAASFVWWADRHPGKTFPFCCRGCGTTVRLKHRVVQGNRKCPGCGRAILVADIDRQLDDWEIERRRKIWARAEPTGCLLVLFAGAFSGVLAALRHL